MIDAAHSYHSPIFDSPKPKKLPPSFYVAVVVAVGLHAGLLGYFYNQKFGLLIVEAPPVTGPIDMTMERPKPPEEIKDTPKPVVENPIKLHPPIDDVPVHVDTIPADPVVDTNPDVGTAPPVLVTGPVTIGTPAEPAKPSPYVTARWTRFPDSNALGDYYPERAAEDEVEGAATVECVVLDAAGRVRCTALSEIPGNYGFGKATVRMVQDKGRVDTSQGNIQVGAKLKATIKWTLG